MPPTTLVGRRTPGSRRFAAQILRADAPPCALYDRKCAGKADNPNCLCGLIPAPTGHRRQGLWQKDAAALAKLGPDPSADKREVQSDVDRVLGRCRIACASQHSRHTARHCHVGSMWTYMHVGRMKNMFQLLSLVS